ncbi:unnamed protein product, partial [Dicrocoelium dendriticum]
MLLLARGLTRPSTVGVTNGLEAVLIENQLHIETEEFFEGVQRTMLVIVMEHLVSVLQGVLGRLTRFDENRILSSFLSLTKSNDEGRRYTTFLHSNLQQLSENMVDEVSLISLCE